jgi:hypothetical protein
MRGPTYDREFLVKKIAMMRIKGKSTYFILDFLQNDIKMGQTTAYEVLREAQKVINDMQAQEIESAFSEAIAQLEELFESTTDKRLRLEVRKEISKMRGLYAAQKIEHSGQVGFTGLDIHIINSKEELEGGTQSNG